LRAAIAICVRTTIEGKSNVKLAEPPSCHSASTIVFIGKNSNGQWVVRQQHGLYGGLFVSHVAAIRYALFENGRHPETIVELSRPLELNIDGGHWIESGPPIVADHKSR
jgi:hypothetical protein